MDIGQQGEVSIDLSTSTLTDTLLPPCCSGVPLNDGGRRCGGDTAGPISTSTSRSVAFCYQRERRHKWENGIVSRYISISVFMVLAFFVKSCDSLLSTQTSPNT